MKNGAKAAVLAQSQRAVRGLHVQKLRCDEVEMFDPQVWVENAQFGCHLERDDRAAVTDDEQARDVNCAHHVMVLRIGRRENI